MKVYLEAVGNPNTESLGVLSELADRSSVHRIVKDASDADLILLLGTLAVEHRLQLGNALYRAFPDCCAVYTEDDHYLPLIPGVYCSAQPSSSTRAGRVFNYSYITRNGIHRNPYLAEAVEEGIAPADGPVAPDAKKYLLSFMGGSTSLVRKRLFRLKFDRPDILIENTSSFLNWDNSQADRLERQRRYVQIMRESDFVLCPRGAGAGSFRLFEVMSEGIAPVLIADDYALPPDIDWDSCVVRVAEKDIARLPQILEKHRSGAKLRGERARKIYRAHFATDKEFDRIVELAMRALQHGPPEEWSFRALQPAMIRSFERKAKLRNSARSFVLKTLKVFRLDKTLQINL